jgi:hypothetical protein
MKSEVTVFNLRRLGVQGTARAGMLAWTVLLGICVLSAERSFASPIWDSNIGNALSGFSSPVDGYVAVNLGAGYAFPFLGQTYTSITVTNTGFVWLGNNNVAECCVLGDHPLALTLFTNDPARIAPAWLALQPNLGGSINFNQITDAQGARTDITYNQVATGGPGNPSVTFQVQLYTSGQIVFSYMTFDSANMGLNTATLIGLTPGQAQTSPQAVDFTALPFTAPGSMYDYLVTANGFNFDGQSIVFTPGAQNTFAVTAAAAVPEPSTLMTAAGAILLLAVTRLRQKRIPK